MSSTWSISSYEFYHVLLIGSCLFPFRATLTLFALSCAWVCGRLALIGYTPESAALASDQTPLNKYRALFVKPYKLLARVLLFALGYIYIDETHDKNNNKDDDQEQPRVIVGNHMAFVEALYIVYKYNASFVAAYENLK